MNCSLNTGRKRFKSAAETAFTDHGAGSNIIYVDRENDLVAMLAAIKTPSRAPFVMHANPGAGSTPKNLNNPLLRTHYASSLR